jgi:hypothetical protein
MVKIIKLFIVVLLSSKMLFSSNFCAANPFYCGFDLGVQHIGFKPGYGDNLFPTDLPMSNLFVGFKFNDYFGIEGGYENTLEQERISTVFGGQTMLGRVVPSDPANGFDYFKFRSKAQMDGWHLGIVANYNLNAIKLNNLSLLGYIGVKNTNIKLTRTGLFAKMVGGFEEIYNDTLLLNKNNKKNFIKLFVGLEYLFTNYIGIRAIFGWENTSKLQPSNGVDRFAKLKDSTSFMIGVLFK